MNLSVVTKHLCLLLILVVSSTAFGDPGDILFEDNFDDGMSAANYSTVIKTGVVDFGGNPISGDIFDASFSYSNLGDASDVRSGVGALFETVGAVTAYVDGLNLDGSIPVSIKYDMYLQWASGGSTEYGFVGVGNGNKPFENWLRGSINGTEDTQGVFSGALTDADTSGSQDYIIAESAGGVMNPTLLYDGDAAGTTQGGTGYATIFPGDGGNWLQATPGYHWTEVEMLINGNEVTYFLEGFEVATVTSGVSPTGKVGFGINDPFPSANNSAMLGDGSGTMMIIDNVVVTEAVPEPVGLTLAAFGLIGLMGLRRACR